MNKCTIIIDFLRYGNGIVMFIKKKESSVRDYTEVFTDEMVTCLWIASKIVQVECKGCMRGVGRGKEQLLKLVSGYEEVHCTTLFLCHFTFSIMESFKRCSLIHHAHISWCPLFFSCSLKWQVREEEVVQEAAFCVHLAHTS